MKFKIFHFNNISSTNDMAIKLIRKKNCENGFVSAFSQKKGRGRRGKKWISLKGNLFSTFFFKMKKNYPTVKEFTLINVILNINLISKYCGKSNTYFKPPNDIYINKKKICGILQEVITKSKRKYLIIGIGTNLVSNPITNNFTSTNILNETNKKPSLLLYKKRLINLYEIFFKNIDKYSFLKFKLKSKKFLLN